MVSSNCSSWCLISSARFLDIFALFFVYEIVALLIAEVLCRENVFTTYRVTPCNAVCEWIDTWQYSVARVKGGLPWAPEAFLAWFPVSVSLCYPRLVTETAYRSALGERGCYGMSCNKPWSVYKSHEKSVSQGSQLCKLLFQRQLKFPILEIMNPLLSHFIYNNSSEKSTKGSKTFRTLSLWVILIKIK